MKTLVLSLLGSLLYALPSALAHQIEVAKDVGATLHVEPNDRPLAGAPSQVWFALTQAGGTAIPLEDCDCTLTVYDAGDTAIATPALIPLSAQGYQDIPGASVTFPDVGAYTLVLAGSPIDGNAFTPFELTFEVTVAGRAVAPPAPESPEPSSAKTSLGDTEKTATAGATTVPTETSPSKITSFRWEPLGIAGGTILALGILWGLMGGANSPGGKT